MSDVHARAHDLLRVHKELLAKWRTRMNLIGPGPLEDHYTDADAALAGLSPQGTWVDLGTGAGFPGVPFAARFPEVAVELVDSRQKRCTFVEEVLLRAAVASVTVRCARLETLDDHSYDGILSRALAAPDVMLRHARRLLRPGGTLVLFLQEHAEVPRADDFTLLHQHTYGVGGKGRRTAWLRLS